MIWIFVALFWAPFILRGRYDKLTGGGQAGRPVHADPNAELLVWLHGSALFMQFAAIGMAMGLGTWWPYPGHAVVGGLVMLGATWLAGWTLLVFKTWRVKAELSHAHELCTEGPFRWIRHPIYTAMFLHALGSALWYPSPVSFAGALAMFIGGELRARAEEKLLLRAFGERYRELLGRTRRFFPGIY